MINTSIVIALLDKTWPPHHSFVDGMLAEELARENDIRVRLFVSRAAHSGSKPRRYLRATCLPALHPRRGVGRILNFFTALRAVYYQVIRERDRGNQVILFVRNDPIYLLTASLLRKHVNRLVFQSSFPHEEYSGHAIKRTLAKWLYRIAGIGVDVVTGVSPEGVARAQRLCRGSEAGGHIPLLVDLVVQAKNPLVSQPCLDAPTFCYIGTHGPGRELETVLKGIVAATSAGSRAHFRFIGAAPEDELRLGAVEGVDHLIRSGTLRFEPAIPRNEVPQVLSECHIGISLIPPKPVYYESSPTKLSEYMGAGLAILASRGIPMQERFLEESNGGLLVDWDIHSISQGICDLSSSIDKTRCYGERSAAYAQQSLKYKNYLPQTRQLLGLSSRAYVKAAPNKCKNIDNENTK